MIQALLSLGHNQFEWARWAWDDKEHYKIIKVEIATENEKRWDTVISNIVTTEDSAVLKTMYNYDYKVSQHIFYRGAWWQIRNIGERSQEINPQALLLVRPEINKQTILEIMKVDWQ